MERTKTREVAFCGLFTALVAVGAFLKIPTPLVPVTMQLFFTTLAGIFLGGKKGALSVVVYLALGLCGFPVFTEGGGPMYVLKPSFGYLVGFAMGAYVTGTMVEKRKKTMGALLWASICGLVVVYVVGAAYYYWICVTVLQMPLSVGPFLVSCFLVPLPGNLVLAVFGAWLGKRLLPLIPA